MGCRDKPAVAAKAHPRVGHVRAAGRKTVKVMAVRALAVPMPAKIGIFLNVQEIDRTVAFYQSIGFRVTERTHDDYGALSYAALSLDGAEIEVGSISAPSRESAAYDSAP